LKRSAKSVRRRARRNPERALRRKKLVKWSKDVRTRDGNKCAYCGGIKYLNAHHLLPKEIYPEYQFELWVGLTLCGMKCHRRFAHWNGLAFAIWLRKNRPEQWAKIEEVLS
jgi:5-methylcytosine-specific restriction endonuclease McrA